MKNFSPTKCIIILAITVAFSSCDSVIQDEKIYSASITGSEKKSMLAENDVRFLVEAYSSGLFKITLANEAQIRSTSEEAVQLANAIITFNTRLTNEIGQIAKVHDIQLPLDISDDNKLIWKQLVKEKGWSFDKKFRELLEQFRPGEVALFENAAINCSDKNITVLAKKARPEIKLHEKLTGILCEKVEAETLVHVEEKEPAKKHKPGRNFVAKI